MPEKKAMILVGSPRKSGNTAHVATWVAQGLEESGVKVEMIDTARLNYKTHGCTSCLGCQQSKEFRCIIRDDASDVLARMPEQDLIVFATPVYFMGFSAQIKQVMDRMYSLFKIDPEKKLYQHNLQKPVFALIATGGGDEGSGFNLLKSTMTAIAGFMGKKAKHFCVPFTSITEDVLSGNTELVEKARDFGRNLL